MDRLSLGLGVLSVLISISAVAAKAAEQEPVTIGLEIPLSPPGDTALGQLIRRGTELGEKYVNEKGGVLGGRKVRVLVEDSKGTPAVAVASFRRLAQQEHAVAVTGLVHSSENLAVNEVAKDFGVPTISIYSGAADITAKHYATAFRTHVIDPLRVTTWLNFIKQNGYKKIALVAETSDYGMGLVNETNRQNDEKKLGLDIKSVTFDRNVTDLTAQLLEVKSARPDLIINIGVGALAETMIDDATTLGLLPSTPMLVSYDSPIRPQFWKLHPQNGVGIYYVGFYSPKQELSDGGRWLVKEYEQKYNEPASYASLQGFGVVSLIAQAVEKAASTDPSAVAKALEAGKFKTWPATDVTFPKADGVYWHNWSPPILIFHYTKPNQDWRDADIVYSYAP